MVSFTEICLVVVARGSFWLDLEEILGRYPAAYVHRLNLYANSNRDTVYSAFSFCNR